MNKKALFIGNSDGIGLAATRRLLEADWEIVGISKSDSPIKNEHYQHHTIDVSDSKYKELLNEIVKDNPPDLCIYFAGIGEFMNIRDMSMEPKVIDVNFTSMVRTASVVIPKMVKVRRGHFIGLSSMADELITPDAPSYCASKAGFSSYLAALRKSDAKPFMISIEKAVDHIEYCIRKKPARYSAPKIAIPFVKLLKLVMKLKIL